MRLDGIDTEGWSAGQVLDLLYTYLVDSVSSVLQPTMTTRRQIDEWLEDATVLPKSARRRAGKAKRESWGLTPEARAGARAMMALAGGPIKKPDG